MTRLTAAFLFGLLALMAALDAGLPFWRDYPIGDAFDFGLTTALATYYLIGAVRGTVIVNNYGAPIARIEAFGHDRETGRDGEATKAGKAPKSSRNHSDTRIA